MFYLFESWYSDPNPWQRWGNDRTFVANLKLPQLLSQISVLSRIFSWICCICFACPVYRRPFHNISTYYFTHQPMHHRGKTAGHVPARHFLSYLCYLMFGGGLFEMNWLISLSSSSMNNSAHFCYFFTTWPGSLTLNLFLHLIFLTFTFKTCYILSQPYVWGINIQLKSCWYHIRITIHIFSQTVEMWDTSDSKEWKNVTALCQLWILRI